MTSDIFHNHNIDLTRLVGEPKYADEVIDGLRAELALRPPGTSDRAPALLRLAVALIWRAPFATTTCDNGIPTINPEHEPYVRESAAHLFALLPLLHAGRDKSGFVYDAVVHGPVWEEIIRKCHVIPHCTSTPASDVDFRRSVLALCLEDNQTRRKAMEMLAHALCTQGGEREIDESIELRRAVAAQQWCPTTMYNLAVTLQRRFAYTGQERDWCEFGMLFINAWVMMNENESKDEDKFLREVLSKALKQYLVKTFLPSVETGKPVECLKLFYILHGLSLLE